MDKRKGYDLLLINAGVRNSVSERKNRPRAGRPRKKTPREDRLISRRARQRPFSTTGALRGSLAFEGHISTRTVIRLVLIIKP
jgi:transposase